MNNILSFEDFLNEDVKKNKGDRPPKNKWNKITIEKVPKTGSIEIKSEGGKLSKPTKEDLSDVLTDDRDLIINVTGKFNGNGFIKKVIENLPYIKYMKELSNEGKGIIFPSSMKHELCNIPKIMYNVLDNDGNETGEQINITEKIFNLIPDRSRKFGRGEILLASYYKNVIRQLEETSGGEHGGDCIAFNATNNQRHKSIEVKSANAHFYTLSHYQSLSKEELDKFEELFKKPLKNIKFEETDNKTDIDPEQIEELDNVVGNDDVKEVNEKKVKVIKKLHEYDDDIKEYAEYLIKDCVAGMAYYLNNIRKKDPKSALSLVFFQNELKSDGSIDFIHIPVRNGIFNIYNKLIEYVDEGVEIHITKRQEKNKDKKHEVFLVSVKNGKFQFEVK